MAYNNNLADFKSKVKKRQLKSLGKVLLAVLGISLIIGIIKPTSWLSMVLSFVLGMLGARYLVNDVKGYKKELIKEEVHKNINKIYIKSDAIPYVYYSQGIPLGIKKDVEQYAREVLEGYVGVLNKSKLKIVIVNESMEGVLNGLFSSLNKKFNNMPENVTGTNIKGLDCIIINYFGLSVTDCIGHEFVHFLVDKDNDAILKDKIYKSYFEFEKDSIFHLEYQEYYRCNISEFTAELGSYILSGSKDVYAYESAKTLKLYLESFKIDGYKQKRLTY